MLIGSIIERFEWRGGQLKSSSAASAPASATSAASSAASSTAASSASTIAVPPTAARTYVGCEWLAERWGRSAAAPPVGCEAVVVGATCAAAWAAAASSH